jgi:YQGE family putative transporter
MKSSKHKLTLMAREVLWSGGFTIAGFATSNIFVSLFFYIASGSISKMALYGIGQYLGLILVSVLLVKLTRKTSPKTLFRFGIVLSALFYATLTLLGHGVSGLAFFLGLFNGVAIGIYWFGNNTLAYDVVEPSERNHYYGLNFAIMSGANVVMPFFSGELISHIHGSLGFKVVFMIAFALLVVAFYSARKLSTTASMGDVSIIKSILLPLESKNWMLMSVALALRSMNQVAQSLGIIVLVVLATHNAGDQGLIASVISIATATASMVAGRIKPVWRKIGMRIGAIGVVAATLILLISHSLLEIILFGLLSGLTYPGLFVPLSTVALDVMDEDENAEANRGGYVLSREISINLGRLVGVGLLLMFLHFLKPFSAVFVVMITSAVAQIVVSEFSIAVMSSTALKTGVSNIPPSHDSLLDTAANAIIRPVGP